MVPRLESFEVHSQLDYLAAILVAGEGNEEVSELGEIDVVDLDDLVEAHFEARETK